MTGIKRTAVLSLALGLTASAYASPITGGFDITGIVSDQTISSQTGFVYFTPGMELPTSGTGTGVFSGITSSDTFDSFTNVLSLYMIENNVEPVVYTLTYQGTTYTFKATSYDPGATVQIAGILSDGNGNTGYGLIDFVSPANQSGAITGTFGSTPSLDVFSDGQTPEPASLTLLATGVGAGLLQTLRRRRRG